VLLSAALHVKRQQQQQQYHPLLARCCQAAPHLSLQCCLLAPGTIWHQPGLLAAQSSLHHHQSLGGNHHQPLLCLLRPDGQMLPHHP
jgi:hypothetical protein